MELETMVEVVLDQSDDFLKVKETLTRIGVPCRRSKTLWQSCHILHKRGKYYIVHFKELFMLDGKPSNISENDIQRRNTVANLLQEWGLLKLKTPEITKDGVPVSELKILSYKEKDEWELVPKYNIGGKKVVPASV